MSDTPQDSAEARFGQLAARFAADPDVIEGTGFGSAPGLRVEKKIFAMLVKGQLVVKLPKARVDELVASGQAGRFDPGHGRLMKEWVTIPVDAADVWKGLAAEALRFVGRRS